MAQQNLDTHFDKREFSAKNKLFKFIIYYNNNYDNWMNALLIK